MSRKRILFLVFILISLTGFVPHPAAFSESALEQLLAQIPRDDRAGDNNIYCLTDIQGVLGAQLSWNALLRRAVLVDQDGTLTFALVVGSSLGRVGTEMVEWSEAPAQRNGEVYVSLGLLEKVFAAYPDYKLPGQSQVVTVPTPVETLVPGEPEEPPPGKSAGDLQIQEVLAILMPSRAVVAAGTPTQASPTSILLDELKAVLQTNGINLKSVVWNPGKPDKSYLEADTLVALRVEAASPPARTAFFYFDIPATVEGDTRGAALVHWNRVSQNHKRDSRAIADLIHRNYISVFGENRSLGLRSAPFSVLEGREVPGILINLGLSSTSFIEEARKSAEIIGQSLSQIRKG